MMGVVLVAFGHDAFRVSSTLSGVFPGASPVRLATLNAWVSMAMVGGRRRR